VKKYKKIKIRKMYGNINFKDSPSSAMEQKKGRASKAIKND
jgi:hypothetical protein